MAIEQVLKDLGAATAYAYAVEKGYTGTEEEFATLMASYASVAQSAAASATAAAGSATSAASSASTASAAATTATTKASEASTSATNAAGSASSAASSATAASGSATSAAASATTASGKASEATTAATTATTAKTDAVAAKTAAQTAQTAAETAQGKAETAQGAAEDAAESVSASAAQIATNTSDISDLKEGLSHKANTDGYYADLVSGGSTQLLSDMVETDTTPYNYRTAGGSLEIGDREKLKKIVGGSLAVNQLAKPVTSDYWSAESNVSVAFADSVATFTSQTINNGIKSNAQKQVAASHVYYMGFSFQSESASAISCLYGGNGGVRVSFTSATSMTGVYKIAKADASATGNIIYFFPATSGVNVEHKVKNVQVFDLTAMLGTTIADYVYGLETATAGAGVEWLKSHFPRIFDAVYIPYNAGTLEHVSGLSEHKMTGFNQFDEVWESGYWDASDGTAKSSGSWQRNKNAVHCVPGAAYCLTQNGNGTLGYLSYYDASDNFISSLQLSRAVASGGYTYTAPANAYYMRFYRSASASGVPFCINLHWDGERDGEYEPYEEHSYPLDSDVTLRGIPKLDANNNLYYDGDEYVSDGTVTRRYVAIVLNGTEAWGTRSEGTKYFTTQIGAYGYVVSDNSISDTWDYAPTLSSSGAHIGYRVVNSSGYNGAYINVRPNNYDVMTVEEFKASLTSHPVTVVYELATPTTESADPYTEIQNVSNWGTEEFVTTSLVPVGHETAYQPDLRAKIEVAPESPDTDGLYLMKRENGQNSYVAYLGELPSDPITDGTYTLKCTVASGTVTKTWEADT